MTTATATTIALTGERALRALHLQAHALLLQAHLALDPHTPFRFGQAKLLVAIALGPHLVGEADLLLLFALLPLGLLAHATFLVLAGTALGFQPDATFILFAADAIVLHPPQLPQGEEGRVLLTLLLGHRRFLYSPSKFSNSSTRTFPTRSSRRRKQLPSQRDTQPLLHGPTSSPYFIALLDRPT